ncbi:MAG: hypothetical protein P8J37_07205 [Fuerstiella sp.]|nr:hypothetical protein [Fuerstiella sp.]
MKPFFSILMFVGVFGFGVLAGRWMVLPGSSSAVGELHSDTDAVAQISALSSDNRDSGFAVNRFTAMETGLAADAGNEVVPVSFEEFAANSPTAASKELPSVRPSRKVSREQVRAVITNRFPDLPAEAVSGWTDTYEGTPPDELELLLEQRKGLPPMLPGGSFLSQATSEFGKLQPTPGDTQGPFASAATIVHKNLLHVATPGFRRRRIVTRLKNFSSAADSGHGLQQRRIFDFQPGAINPSQHPLHLAIVDHPELMFQLEPGNLLTRSGTFIRLADGRLGIETDGGTAAIFSRITIPEDAGTISVSMNGVVRFNDSTGKVQSVGNLKLAIVSGLDDLQSVNGVFFTTSTDPSWIPTAEGTPVVTNALESSNVDIDYEWKLADHYSRLNSL